MRFVVTSDRTAWPQGAVLTEQDLRMVNISAWVIGGHIEPINDGQPPSDDHGEDE